MNALAALALVRAIGCALGPSLQALRDTGANRTAPSGSPRSTRSSTTTTARNQRCATLAAIQGLASESRKLV